MYRIIVICMFTSICNAFIPKASPSHPIKKIYMQNEWQSNWFPFSYKLGEPYKYSDLFDDSKLKNIEAVSIFPDGKSAYVVDKLHEYHEVTPSNLHLVTLQKNSMDTLMDSLIRNHIDVVNLPDTSNSFLTLLQKFGDVLLNLSIYFVVFSLVSRFIFKNTNAPNNLSAISKFQSDNFQILQPNDSNTTFADVAGCDEAKFELVEVVDFLKNGEKYTNIGAQIPKGVLLEGTPGTGKTLMARAVAGEAGVPFISASGSEFIELFVGVGASRVRNLFTKARELSPCVVFIDEIDAIGRQRGAGIAGGNDEREQTLNQILTNMDGFDSQSGVIVIAATNRADILDSALMRPGRFDRKVKVPLPSFEGRKRIFDVHLKNKKLNEDIELDNMASISTGMSGADIANLVNEAAILSIRSNSTGITNAKMYDAYEKVAIGIQSLEQEIDKDIQELVSFHECGHAIVVLLFKEMFDLKKITINSNTNGAGGYTLFTPKDKYAKFATKRFMLANLIVALGGRAAEVFLYRKVNKVDEKYDDIFSGLHDLDVTTGASNDLIQANRIARDYITRYGFGETQNYYDPQNSEQPFMGRELTMSNDKISEYTRRDIDTQISQLVSYAQEKAYQIILRNQDSFLKLVALLKEKRNISPAEISNLIVCYTCNLSDMYDIDITETE